MKKLLKYTNDLKTKTRYRIVLECVSAFLPFFKIYIYIYNIKYSLVFFRLLMFYIRKDLKIQWVK